MLLIDVTVSPRCTISRFEEKQAPQVTRQFIRKEFGPKLPELFARNGIEFGIWDITPEAGVQVRYYDYDEDDLNTPELWIKVQLRKESVAMSVQRSTRDGIYDGIVTVIRELGAEPPADFILEVTFGDQAHGFRVVGGEVIEW
jgi:hypothetical protein